MSKKKFERTVTESPLSRALAENEERLRQVAAETSQPASPALAVVKEPKAQQEPKKPPVPTRASRPAKTDLREQTAERERSEAVRRKAEEAAKRRREREDAQAAAEEEPEKSLTPEPPPRGRKRARHLELEDDEFDQVDDFIRALKRPSGGKVSFNVLGRALLRIAMRAEDQLFDELRKNPPGRKPANDKPDELSLYEDDWERVLEMAIRQSPAASRRPPR